MSKHPLVAIASSACSVRLLPPWRITRSRQNSTQASWEGETLVVDTIGVDTNAKIPVSASGVDERYFDQHEYEEMSKKYNNK